MAAFESADAAPYRDPWDQPLPQRLRQLARGRCRVAYFYERADNSTFRYRVYNMTQVLNLCASEVSASYFFLDDLHCRDELAELADLLVICRTRYDQRVNQLIMAFRRHGKRVLYDIDDLVFDLDYAHLVSRTIHRRMQEDADWDSWYAYTGRLGATLRLCDGAITTNDQLALRLREFSGLPVAVVPNFLNREQLEPSEQLFAAKRQRGWAADGPIVLGYFSGSPSHNADYAMVAPALARLLEEDSRLHVAVVGYIEPGPQLAAFGERVKRFPFQDFVNLQRLIASVRFNLMPLQYNAFTNCKSELKYFEAAVVGTVSVASPVHTYAGAIRDGENGYLAKAHEWYSVLRHALSQEEQYAAMAEAGFDDAHRKYAWSHQTAVIRAALGLDPSGPPLNPGRTPSRLGSRWSLSGRPTLRDLHDGLVDKVSDKWTSYLDVYDELFSPLRDQPVSLLEIGVQNGGSLDLWRSYFSSGERFIGCDIDSACADLTFDDPRVQVVVGDATDPSTQARVGVMCKRFDIVIDDGSHTCSDVVNAFLRYFPMLKPGGIYCIEDTHTLFWPEFGGGLDNDRGGRRFFQALTDVLNFEHWRTATSVTAQLLPHAEGSELPAEIEEGWVDSVEFRNSIIVVRRSSRVGHDKLGGRSIVGRQAAVTTEPLDLRATAVSVGDSAR